MWVLCLYELWTLLHHSVQRQTADSTTCLELCVQSCEWISNLEILKGALTNNFRYWDFWKIITTYKSIWSIMLNIWSRPFLNKCISLDGETSGSQTETSSPWDSKTHQPNAVDSSSPGEKPSKQSHRNCWLLTCSYFAGEWDILIPNLDLSDAPYSYCIMGLLTFTITLLFHHIRCLKLECNSVSEQVFSKLEIWFCSS